MGRRKRKKKRLIILIIVMLLMTVAAAGYILHRGTELSGERAETVKDAVIEDLQETAESLPDITALYGRYEVADHVYSYRGSEGSLEHSFQAYDAAIEAGSHNIHQDIVISSDGVLFVSYEISGLKMTGNRDFYKDMTAAEIDELRTHEGNKILRLSEVFDKYGRDVHYLVQFSVTGSDIVTAFEEIIDQYGYEDIVTAMSDEPEVLETLEEKYPDMTKMLVCKTPGLFTRSLDMPYVDNISVKVIAGLMKEERVQLAHEHDKEFSAWTLDTESEIKSAIDMGVDSYFTNDTALAIGIEEEYGVETRGKQ